MKNESRAAWERICCPYGPGWPPKKDPPETSQTICFKLFLKLFGGPSKHPICAHQKMDHPKWTPKSSQGNRTKHCFSGRILLILIFGIHLVAAPSVPFMWKIIKKNIHFITFLTRSLGPTWGTTRNIKSCKMSAALHGSASAKKKTSAALHGNDFAIWMVQMGPSKQASPKQPKPYVVNFFECFFEPI